MQIDLAAQVLSVNVFYLLSCYIDVNECTMNNGGCAQSCTNSPGSYYCNCSDGYSLNLDEHSCSGIIKFLCTSGIFLRYQRV